MAYTRYVCGKKALNVLWGTKRIQNMIFSLYKALSQK